MIGIDSADWKIIDALVAQGRMPNLASLRERGTSGPIQTLVDFPLSPVIWTSVATGKTPAKHGITWFLVDQPDGTRVPVRSHNRKAKALWNILGRARPSLDRARLVGDLPGRGRRQRRRSSPTRSASTASAARAREGDDQGKTWPADLFPKLEALMPPEQQLSPEFVRASCT